MSQDKKNKILIIDRQAWVMDLVNKGLHSDDYTVSVAEDAEKIEKYFKAHNYDLVLLNFYLKYGYSTCNVLKRIKMLNPDLPVIVLSAWDKSLDTAILNIADDFITKSHNTVNEFKQKVNRIFYKNQKYERKAI